MAWFAVRPSPPPDDRFWSKVQKRSSGCWEWTGFIGTSGYGRVCRSVDGKSHVYQAHRVSYEGARGPIPRGKVLDHLCRNRACVNPDHLEVVTQGENIARGDWFVAQNAMKSHCPAGHPYDIENTYVNPASGGRTCRTCRAAARGEEQRRALRRAADRQERLLEGVVP